MDTRCSALAVVAFGLVFAHGVAWADDADLDPTFGVGGVAMTGLSDASGEGAFGPVIQPDGRILVCDTRTTSGTSNWDFVVARFNANGTLDTGFNFNGLVGIDFNSGFDYCTGIALQADGKIVVAGSTYASGSQDFAVARLQPNGALDPTFGAGSGKVTVSFDLGGLIDVGKAVAIQSDGKIIVAGSASTASDGTDFAVVRLLPDGTRDAAFNLTGRVTFGFDVPGNNSNDGALAVAIDGAGRIVLGGNASSTNGGTPSSDFALARLLPNGQLDPNFDADGRANIAFDLRRQRRRPIQSADDPDGRAHRRRRRG